MQANEKCSVMLYKYMLPCLRINPLLEGMYR
jgi:hypothetical protein